MMVAWLAKRPPRAPWWKHICRPRRVSHDTLIISPEGITSIDVAIQYLLQVIGWWFKDARGRGVAEVNWKEARRGKEESQKHSE